MARSARHHRRFHFPFGWSTDRRETALDALREKGGTSSARDFDRGGKAMEGFFTTTTGLALAVVLVCSGIAPAADYYMYKDATGTTILSNLSPTARPLDVPPEMLETVKKYDLPEATDEQIATAAAAERALMHYNAVRDRTRQLERMADEFALLRLQAPLFGEINAPNIVVVNRDRLRRSQSPPVIAQPPGTKGRR